MPYSPQTWNNGSGGGTPLSAARLNFMENGIDEAHETADEALSDAATAAVAATTAQAAADAAQADADAAQTTANGRIPASTLTTKGDILVRTSSAVVRQAIGTDGRFLEADSAQTNGLKWGRKFTVSPTEPSSPTTGDIWLRPVT